MRKPVRQRLRVNVSQRLSGDQRTSLELRIGIRRHASAVVIFFWVLVAVSSSQSCLSLSWWAIHLPSGEGIALPPQHFAVGGEPLARRPSPLAGIFQNSTSPLSVESDQQRLAVRHEARVAEAPRLARRHIHEPALSAAPRRPRPREVSTTLLPVRREVRGSRVFIGSFTQCSRRWSKSEASSIGMALSAPEAISYRRRSAPIW